MQIKFLPFLFFFTEICILYISSHMNNFLKEIKGLFTISLTALTLFFIHQFLVLEIFKNEKPPLISIYFFNYSAVLFLLSLFKINLHYKLINPLTSFVILTFIKMLSVVGYFIYFNNYEDFDITILVYNFFPVYFLLLTMEILNLKKSLNNIWNFLIYFVWNFL